MSNKEPRPTGNVEFDAWWPKVRTAGPSHDDWSMDDYEYHPIDEPMLDAFEAGQEAERLAILKWLNGFRDDFEDNNAARGETPQEKLSNFIADVKCRAFKNFLERGRDIPGG